MTKGFRQAQILKLVRGESVSTQEELAERLSAMGVEVSQVTLSRDIRELGLIKSAGAYREPNAATSEGNPDSLRRVLQEFLRDIRVAQNIVVLKTAPGGAQPIARALDSETWPEIVGTVAGDDTIFVAASQPASAKRLQKRLLGMW